MSPGEIERTKLRAAFLDPIASSSIVASVITPAVGLSINVINLASSNFWSLPKSVFRRVTKGHPDLENNRPLCGPFMS